MPWINEAAMDNILNIRDVSTVKIHWKGPTSALVVKKKKELVCITDGVLENGKGRGGKKGRNHKQFSSNSAVTCKDQYKESQ
jgi:hypothetical protein